MVSEKVSEDQTGSMVGISSSSYCTNYKYHDSHRSKMRRPPTLRTTDVMSYNTFPFSHEILSLSDSCKHLRRLLYSTTYDTSKSTTEEVNHQPPQPNITKKIQTKEGIENFQSSVLFWFVRMKMPSDVTSVISVLEWSTFDDEWSTFDDEWSA